jgi:hypothetical protein
MPPFFPIRICIDKWIIEAISIAVEPISTEYLQLFKEQTNSIALPENFDNCSISFWISTIEVIYKGG